MANKESPSPGVPSGDGEQGNTSPGVPGGDASCDVALTCVCACRQNGGHTAGKHSKAGTARRLKDETGKQNNDAPAAVYLALNKELAALGSFKAAPAGLNLKCVYPFQWNSVSHVQLSPFNSASFCVACMAVLKAYISYQTCHRCMAVIIVIVVIVITIIMCSLWKLHAFCAL